MTLRAFKVGGIRFLRIGRLQLSLCVVRRKYEYRRLWIAGRCYGCEARVA